MRATNSALFLVLALTGACLGAPSASASPERPTVAPRLGKGDPGKGKAKVEAGPTLVDKKVKLSPEGLRFGMTLDEVSKLYEKVIADESVALYQGVEPGPRMAELDAEVADRKLLIKRNKLEFGSLPSGLDNTPLVGEYTYDNGETMTRLKLRTGVERFFFFFGDRLWKVYDAHKLGKKDKLGEDFAAAVDALGKQLGKPPRARAADRAAGRHFDQSDWQDKETIIRLTDRGSDAALSWIDRKVEESIEKYRANKPKADRGVDASIADITRTEGAKGDDKNKNVADAYTKKKH